MAARTQGYASILCIVQGSAIFALPACAADGWGGSLAATTDYVFRGVSQTRGQPAAQAGLQLQSRTGWSAGVWGSSVDFGSRAGVSHEIDLHASRAWSMGPHWSAQLGLVHYEYLSERSADYDDDYDYDYDEVTAAVSWQQRLTASIAWSPNTSRFGDGGFVRNREALAYELAVLQPLNASWSLCAGVGYYDLSHLFGTGYAYWNAGLAFTWGALQVDLLHIGTDADARRLFGSPRTGVDWTAALTWRF